MNYNTHSPSIPQFAVNNKVFCAAQCACQFSTCQTAVFDYSATPHYSLFSEILVHTSLINATTAAVYDFQENNFNEDM